MKILINSIKLTNFKGIKSLTVQFNDEITEILGRNATGKTSIFDAFTWLLFGKDSSDRKDFEIKPLYPDGKPLQKADYEVTGQLTIDGQSVTIRRVYKEKWVKKRGSEEPEFTGHETNFFVNDVPYGQKEYQDYINSLIPEQNFKLVTNPAYFNALPKDKRREMLMSIAGEITPEMIAGDDNELKGLLHTMITSQKTLEQLKKEYAAKKKRLKEELDQFPARIAEAQRGQDSITKVELSEAEASEIESLTQKVIEVSNLHDQAVKGFKNRRNQLAEIESKIIQRESEVRKLAYSERDSQQEKITSLKLKLNSTESEIKLIESKIQNLVKENKLSIEKRNALRETFNKEAAKKFTYEIGDIRCHACHQELPNSAEKIEQLRGDFNRQKSHYLEQIQSTGITLKNKSEVLEKVIQEHTEHLALLQKQLQIQKGELEKLVQNYTPELPPLGALLNEDIVLIQLHEQQRELSSVEDQHKAETLLGQIKQIESRRDVLTNKVAQRDAYLKQAEYFSKRIEELSSLQKSTAGELASLERVEYQIERYKKTHDSILESRINSAFELVTFRMYGEQINGGESETCETLIDGVPYSNANHAAQINAGIDICNTFSRILGVQAPIWADNAEAVNQLHHTPSQLVKLTVTNDETLTINKLTYDKCPNPTG